jgi:hypothetical protein
MRHLLDFGPATRPSVRRESVLVMGMLIVVAWIGWMDYAIGLDLRLYPLYIPPIAVAAWKVGARAGAIVAMASVGAWIISHRLGGQELPLGVWVGNSVAHMAAFATIIALLSSLRRSHVAER